MRISDWSSDVCSSDLPVGVAEKGIGLSPRIVPRRLEIGQLRFGQRQHGVRVLEPAEREIAGGRQQLAPGIGAFQQIGRASCRASVCQYVLISVVAVSLYNKTYSHGKYVTTDTT